MLFPIPALMARDIYTLKPQDILRFGIKFLMLDLDNTLAPYHVYEADAALCAWVRTMQEAGLELFILSNNHGQRPAHFAGQLGVGYINRAKKPRRAAAQKVVAEKGYTPAETALLGDQIYTDVLCAVRCGFLPICVRPICISRNPLLALRYFLELPFRFCYFWRARV